MLLIRATVSTPPFQHACLQQKQFVNKHSAVDSLQTVHKHPYKTLVNLEVPGPAIVDPVLTRSSFCLKTVVVAQKLTPNHALTCAWLLYIFIQDLCFYAVVLGTFLAPHHSCHTYIAGGRASLRASDGVEAPSHQGQ